MENNIFNDLKNIENLKEKHKYDCGYDPLNRLCFNDYNLRNECIWLICAALVKNIDNGLYIHTLKLADYYTKRYKKVVIWDTSYINDALELLILSEEEVLQVGFLPDGLSFNKQIYEFILLIDHMYLRKFLNIKPIVEHIKFIISNEENFKNKK